MSLQSFPRFLELPQELQIQVWEHAIQDIPFINSLGWQYVYSTPQPRLRRSYEPNSVKFTTHKGRVAYTLDYMRVMLFGILNASRLARLIAFEFWRDRVAESMADVPEPISIYREAAYSRRTVLAILNEFIEELQS